MRRRWQRERSEVSHADDWLMTYADMITLLLCFFAVLLTASASRKDVAAVQIAAAAVDSVRPSQTTTPIRFAPRLETVEDAVAAPPMAKVVRTTADAANAKVEPPPERLPAATSRVDTPSGDRITTIEMNSATFFDSGSATLSKAGEAVLRDIAITLTSEALGDYQITVEGHTDDMPISTAQFPSNWELSTARAAAVVHFFLNENIPARRLRAAGYADTFPKAPNRDERGNAIPENQTQNRRVVIKLEKIERSSATRSMLLDDRSQRRSAYWVLPRSAASGDTYYVLSRRSHPPPQPSPSRGEGFRSRVADVSPPPLRGRVGRGVAHALRRRCRSLI